MSTIAKVLRWYFGAEALLFVAAPALALWSAPPLRSLHPEGLSSHALARVWVTLTIFLGAQLALAAIFGMAWWTLPKGQRSSRVWAIAASVLNIPWLWIGRPMWIATAAGLVGVYVFSRRGALCRIAQADKPPRVAGDGTSRLLDLTAQLSTTGGVLAGLFWWSHWAATKHLSTLDGLPLLLEIIPASLITSAVHESGHALASSSKP